MENLKKVISLHQSSRISGYHHDYLSSLLRKKEIKGGKMGGNWFTTEEEVKNYIFKQKIRNKNAIVKHILNFAKANSSSIYAFTFLAIFIVGIYFYNKVYSEIQIETVNTKFSDINKSEIKEAAEEMNKEELQF